MRRFFLIGLMATLALQGCAQSNSLFADPGTNLATPNAMVVDATGTRLYVVNSNAKVLYDYTKGSFQVYNIANPLKPELLKSTETPSFSGQIYIDAARNRALVPNRYSADSSVIDCNLLTFGIDEAAPEFLSFTQSTLSRDPYGIACCYPAERAWVTTSYNLLQYFPLSDVTSVGNVPLDTQIDTGGDLGHAEVDHIVLNGSQAYLSREYGGILVVNLDKAGDPAAVAVDYFIADVPNPRGLAFDGRYLYVVEEGDEDGDWHRRLLVLDLSTLTPLTGNATTHQVDKEEEGLLVAAIEVGLTPEEVLLTSAYAFVTNQEDNTVSVIDLASLTKVTDIPIGDDTEPFSMALYRLPDGTEKYLYVGNVESNTLTIIDIPTLVVVGTYP